MTDDRGSELCRVEASQDQFVAKLERVRAERRDGIGDFLLPRGGVVRIEEEEDEEREGEKRYMAYLRVDNADVANRDGDTFSGVGATINEAMQELRGLAFYSDAKDTPEAIAPNVAEAVVAEPEATPSAEAQAAEPEATTPSAEAGVAEPEGEGDDVEAMMAKMMAELEELKAESKSLEEEAKGE